MASNSAASPEYPPRQDVEQPIGSDITQSSPHRGQPFFSHALTMAIASGSIQSSSVEKQDKFAAGFGNPHIAGHGNPPAVKLSIRYECVDRSRNMPERPAGNVPASHRR